MVRINPMGLQYKIVGEITGVSCEVTCETNGAKCTIHMNIEQISQAWYNWQMKGQYAQVAFHPLPAEQREFLMSGITPAKWKELFGDDDEDKVEATNDRSDN